MPAGKIVILGHAVETQFQINGRHRNLRRIDGAGFKGDEDVTRGKLRRGDAQPLHDLGAKAEEPHFQTFEVLDGANAFAEPPRCLGGNQSAKDAVNAVGMINFLELFLAAAEINPCQEFLCRRPEGNRGEQLQGRNLVAPEPGRGKGGVDGPGADGIEHFQGRHQGAGFVKLDFQHAVRNPPNIPIKPFRKCPQLRQGAGVGAGHFQVHGFRPGRRRGVDRGGGRLRRFGIGKKLRVIGLEFFGLFGGGFPGVGSFFGTLAGTGNLSPRWGFRGRTRKCPRCGRHIDLFRERGVPLVLFRFFDRLFGQSFSLPRRRGKCLFSRRRDRPGFRRNAGRNLAPDRV